MQEFGDKLRCLMVKFGIAAAAAATAAGYVQAGPLPALTISPLPVAGSSNTQSQTLGWEFRPTIDVSVSSLGLLDMLADGLVDAHEIGLWRNDGTLLISTTVPEGTGTTMIGDFRYVGITPVPLTAGQDYVIGALYLAASNTGPSDLDSDKDPFVDFGSGAPRMFAPEIEFIKLRFGSQQVGNLLFPTGSIAGFPAIVGPGFLFEASNPTPMPEPGTLGLLGLGLAALGLARRRRTRSDRTVA